MTLHESVHLGGSNLFVAGPSDIVNYPVRTYTLNYLFDTGLIDKIDFLKVDIEGAEILTFNGISDENLLKVKTIAMEYHHAQLNYDDELRNRFIKRFNSLGFNTYLLYLGANNQLQYVYVWK